MASYNTQIRMSAVLSESEKAYRCIVMDKNDRWTPYNLSKKLCEWKKLDDGEPVLFAQTWYASRIGLAASQPVPA